MVRLRRRKIYARTSQKRSRSGNSPTPSSSWPKFPAPASANSRKPPCANSSPTGAGINLRPYLSIDFSPMTDAQYEHDETLINNLADQTVISDPVFPEFAEFSALKCLAYSSRIV